MGHFMVMTSIVEVFGALYRSQDLMEAFSVSGQLSQLLKRSKKPGLLTQRLSRRISLRFFRDTPKVVMSLT